jgi:predicted amidohydrolase
LSLQIARKKCFTLPQYRSNALREGVLVAATLFINAHLLDPDQGLDEIGQLRVEEGKIAAIGRHLPVCGAEVVDLRGQLLTPG